MAKRRSSPRPQFVLHENPLQGKSHGNQMGASFGGDWTENGGWNPLGNMGPLANSDNQRDQRYMRRVKPRTPNQKIFLDAIEKHPLTIALGPAGTGKTYLAITAAVEAFEAGTVARIVLTRPAIEAGESLGFLPGDLEDKMAPYLRPLFDALSERLGSKTLRKMMAEGDIEIAPVAYMRGRTLNNAFIVIDEAQNCTQQQLKMLLSRLGWHAKMVVTGDPDQSDLLNGLSGLAEIGRRLESSENIAVVQLNENDIVRHPLVGEIIERLS